MSDDSPATPEQRAQSAAEEDEAPLADAVRRAGDVVTAALSAVDDEVLWDRPAGTLSWSCRRTMAHVAGCCIWYSALLARGASTSVEAGPEAENMSPVADLLDYVTSGAAVLAAVIQASSPRTRAWHAYGRADRSGFAAMACDEMLVHTHDTATGLGIDFTPPEALCDQVLRRIFPWAPAAEDPWRTLLWANGRVSLGDHPPEREWLWHCAPLSEWDGRIRRREPRPV